MRSQRQLKVGEEIRHALAGILMRGDVPWPQGFKSPATVTVTEVQVSPDLKNATVFVMPLGGERLDETVKALNEVVGFYRHAVGQNVNLRHVPKLRFSADHSFDYAHRIDIILHEPGVARDLDAPHNADDFDDNEDEE
ncbi:MAG: 30S ribosome-binding factor RbfA [Alphaproteobacteria bacterium]|nr:30S ribosome-binding factor RbfA [Alphaproteobacteria bacterium]